MNVPPKLKVKEIVCGEEVVVVVVWVEAFMEKWHWLHRHGWLAARRPPNPVVLDTVGAVRHPNDDD